MTDEQAQAIATVFGGLEIKLDDINRRLDDVKKTMEHQNALNQKEHEKDRAINKNYMRIVVGLLGALTVAAFRGWLGF